MRIKELLSGRSFTKLLRYLKLLLLIIPLSSFSQIDSTISLTYDFNDHEVKENNHQVQPRANITKLTYDRFGNPESALQLVGTSQSYLNLGVSKLLQSPVISVSLWIKIANRVYFGKGDDCIPFLGISNGPGVDFINALALGYDNNSRRFGANSTRDSLEEVIISSGDSIIFNKWYHFVVVCSNDYFALYQDGELVGETKKNFETKFLASDSLVIGHTASEKNPRFMRGVVDDIHIYHKVLSPADVLALYNAPNPNEFKNMMSSAFKYVLIIAGLILVIIILIIRNRRILRKQKEELELSTRIAELELRAIKSKMNPHFISNSLSAIQELNYNHDVEKAGLYIAKFSYFLRQILDYSDEDYITVSEEIVMVRLFVELEQLRFKESFVFDLIVEDSFNTEEVMVPSLITQPFIENAIWHGLLPLRDVRMPKLTVRILMRNGWPVIEVEDNGVGRDATKKTKRKSKGTQLVIDKIEALNRLSKTSNYKINIVDLVNAEGNKLGTKIIIDLDNIKE